MQTDAPDPKPGSNWKASIWIIISSALIWGVGLAAGSYIGVLASGREWMRADFIRDVQTDTSSMFAHRFLLGLLGGAIVGLLLAIRDKQQRDSSRQ